MKAISRRGFMVNGAVAAAGAAAALSLGPGLLQPPSARASEIEFLESDCRTGRAAARRILVAYDSQCGSTGGVAEAIGKTLCTDTTAVDVRLLKNLNDLSLYQAAVIGSSVQSSQWLPGALDFVERHRDDLKKIPVAYFLTCLALYETTPETRRVAESYMEPALDLAPEVDPVDLGLFAGALDYSRLGWIKRTVMKRKMKARGVPEGDFRNWTAINAWAQTIAPKLAG